MRTMAAITMTATITPTMMNLRRRAGSAAPVAATLAPVAWLPVAGAAAVSRAAAGGTVGRAVPRAADGDPGRAGSSTALLIGPASMRGTASDGSQPEPQAWVQASARATPNDSALANRSAGSVASPRITTAATGPGTSGVTSRSGTGFS
jgi:hypothetical protein